MAGVHEGLEGLQLYDTVKGFKARWEAADKKAQELEQQLEQQKPRPRLADTPKRGAATPSRIPIRRAALPRTPGSRAGPTTPTRTPGSRAGPTTPTRSPGLKGVASPPSTLKSSPTSASTSLSTRPPWRPAGSPRVRQGSTSSLCLTGSPHKSKRQAYWLVPALGPAAQAVQADASDGENTSPPGSVTASTTGMRSAGAAASPRTPKLCPLEPPAPDRICHFCCVWKPSSTFTVSASRHDCTRFLKTLPRHSALITVLWRCVGGAGAPHCLQHLRLGPDVPAGRARETPPCPAQLDERGLRRVEFPP